jgi:hypothetical protein
VSIDDCAVDNTIVLPAGPAGAVQASLVDVAAVPSAVADGDYVSGHTDPVDQAGELFSLRLTTWRVGPHEP